MNASSASMNLWVRLTNGNHIQGRVARESISNNAGQNNHPFPNAWCGSITLRDESGKETEIDYLDIDTVYPIKPA
jgi:hypothetical protein